MGTNRNGQSFLDALLPLVGLTQLEFDTVFSLWVEQCRQGRQYLQTDSNRYLTHAQDPRTKMNAPLRRQHAAL